MDCRDLLTDGFDRIRELVGEVCDGLDVEQLQHRPTGQDGARGNSIGWLVWHLARVQDDHVAGLADVRQAWDEGWRDRFGLDLPHDDIGYGHDAAAVDAVRVQDAQLLLGYHAAVDELTSRYLAGVDADELDRVVDERWDPPVTAGVRLVSIQGDCLQHLGQAAYLKGLLTT